MNSADSLAEPPIVRATKGCMESISMVTTSLTIEGVDFADYKLISNENLVTSHGPDVWLLTFKLRRLLPRTPEFVMGAGGELFVRVNINSRSISVAYGE